MVSCPGAALPKSSGGGWATSPRLDPRRGAPGVDPAGLGVHVIETLFPSNVHSLALVDDDGGWGCALVAVDGWCAPLSLALLATSSVDPSGVAANVHFARGATGGGTAHAANCACGRDILGTLMLSSNVADVADPVCGSCDGRESCVDSRDALARGEMSVMGCCGISRETSPGDHDIRCLTAPPVPPSPASRERCRCHGNLIRMVARYLHHHPRPLGPCFGLIGIGRAGQPFTLRGQSQFFSFVCVGGFV